MILADTLPSLASQLLQIHHGFVFDLNLCRSQLAGESTLPVTMILPDAPPSLASQRLQRDHGFVFGLNLCRSQLAGESTLPVTMILADAPPSLATGSYFPDKHSHSLIFPVCIRFIGTTCRCASRH
jgi:hypothetical protein